MGVWRVCAWAWSTAISRCAASPASASPRTGSARAWPYAYLHGAWTTAAVAGATELGHPQCSLLSRRCVCVLVQVHMHRDTHRYTHNHRHTHSPSPVPGAGAACRCHVVANVGLRPPPPPCRESANGTAPRGLNSAGVAALVPPTTSGPAPSPCVGMVSRGTTDTFAAAAGGRLGEPCAAVVGVPCCFADLTNAMRAMNSSP